MQAVTTIGLDIAKSVFQTCSRASKKKPREGGAHLKGPSRGEPSHAASSACLLKRARRWTQVWTQTARNEPEQPGQADMAQAWK
jgi:hypothetical protein